ncbi:hypothetical protein FRC12_024582 [Ceratobasidium sp. 428]|nr:hypothetical protein FRC12_024582 [Ceratobasidium sp. 428]
MADLWVFQITACAAPLHIDHGARRQALIVGRQRWYEIQCQNPSPASDAQDNWPHTGAKSFPRLPQPEPPTSQQHQSPQLQPQDAAWTLEFKGVVRLVWWVSHWDKDKSAAVVQDGNENEKLDQYPSDEKLSWKKETHWRCAKDFRPPTRRGERERGLQNLSLRKAKREMPPIKFDPAFADTDRGRGATFKFNSEALTDPPMRVCTPHLPSPIPIPAPVHFVIPASLSPLTRCTEAWLCSSSLLLARPVRPRVAHIPSLAPLITRETLKELNLEAIKRNSQLRSSPDPGHDLLFNLASGFTPPSGCKKRELTAKCWQAVQIEINSGSVCTSFDECGRRLPCLCRVLHSVVHSATTDAALVAQELRHDIFDSRSVFRTLGAVLKQRCASMRNCAVEIMVSVAARPGGGVCAVRMCLEILKLMKLVRLSIAVVSHPSANLVFQYRTLQTTSAKRSVPTRLRLPSSSNRKRSKKQHERGLLTLITTQAWLRKARRSISINPAPAFSPADRLNLPPPTNVSTPPPPSTTALSQRLPHIRLPLPRDSLSRLRPACGSDGRRGRSRRVIDAPDALLPTRIPQPVRRFCRHPKKAGLLEDSAPPSFSLLGEKHKPSWVEPTS